MDVPVINKKQDTKQNTSLSKNSRCKLGIVEGDFCFDDASNYAINYIPPSRLCILRDVLAEAPYHNLVLRTTWVLDKIIPVPLPNELRAIISISNTDMLKAYSFYQNKKNHKIKKLVRSLEMMRQDQAIALLAVNEELE